MISVLLVIQVFVTVALIGIVLIQRSEGGGLGLGSSQGMGSFMTGRGTANLLTRATAILATLFMALSLVLALLYKHGSEGGSALSILNTPPPPAASSTTTKPAPALPPIPGESQPASTAPATTAPAPAATAHQSGAYPGPLPGNNLELAPGHPGVKHPATSNHQANPAFTGNIQGSTQPNTKPGQSSPAAPASPQH